MNNRDNHIPGLQEVLKKRIATGDEAAFRQLFDMFFPGIANFTYSIVRSKDAATDIADDVFINIWNRREKITGIDNLKVYLYKAAKNASLNYLSRSASKAVSGEFDDITIQLADETDPEKIMMAGELSRIILASINTLPPRCKMIFKLVREDGLAYKEVAEILSLSVKTVDAQMVIAVSRIREAIAQHVSLSRGKK